MQSCMLRCWSVMLFIRHRLWTIKILLNIHTSVAVEPLCEHVQVSFFAINLISNAY